MIRAAVLAAAMATTLGIAALPAAAQRAGLYGVTGAGPGKDAETYEGAATLTPLGDGTWEVTWRIGRDIYRGVGLVAEGLLAVAYVTEGNPGVALYRPQPDGSLLGTWTTGGSVATERLTPR